MKSWRGEKESYAPTLSFFIWDSDLPCGGAEPSNSRARGGSLSDGGGGGSTLSLLQDRKTKRKSLFPSHYEEEVKKIYRVMEVELRNRAVLVDEGCSA